METISLKATKRPLLGKKVRKLRRENKTPAVLFGMGDESIPLTLATSDIEKAFQEAGESSLIELTIDTQKQVNTIISDITFHPVTEKILHTSLRRVSLTKKISTQVPINLEGESPAVESGEGILLQLLNEIEVTCFPQDIPHEIVMNISSLEHIDDALHVSDIKVNTAKVELSADPEDLVVKVDYAQQEEEEEGDELSEAELVEGVEATAESEPTVDDIVQETSKKE
jgi:large subunit ribosomal protein L25